MQLPSALIDGDTTVDLDLLNGVRDSSYQTSFSHSLDPLQSFASEIGRLEAVVRYDGVVAVAKLHLYGWSTAMLEDFNAMCDGFGDRVEQMQARRLRSVPAARQTRYQRLLALALSGANLGATIWRSGHMRTTRR